MINEKWLINCPSVTDCSNLQIVLEWFCWPASRTQPLFCLQLTFAPYYHYPIVFSKNSPCHTFCSWLEFFSPLRISASFDAANSNKSAPRGFAAGTTFLRKEESAVLPNTCASAPNPLARCGLIPLQNELSPILETTAKRLLRQKWWTVWIVVYKTSDSSCSIKWLECPQLLAPKQKQSSATNFCIADNFVLNQFCVYYERWFKILVARFFFTSTLPHNLCQHYSQKCDLSPYYKMQDQILHLEVIYQLFAFHETFELLNKIRCDCFAPERACSWFQHYP